MIGKVQLCFAVVFLSLSGPNAHADKDTKAVPTLSTRTVVSGLSSPWDIAFAPNGSMFFTEKCRGLSVRSPGGQITRLFGTEGSALNAPDLLCEGQSGMTGIALDPAFAENRVLFVYMSSQPSGGEKSNRVVRLQLNESSTGVANRTDIVTDIAYKQVRNAWGGPGSHSGGRIRFGPDGFLYVPTGDNHNGPLPQDLSKLGGKVLRIDGRGQPAPGNGTPSGGDPRIYTYGHRNVQGLTFRPELGTPYIAEHGPNHSDEVTALKPGGNGGWDPKPAPGVTCADNYCGYVSNRSDGRLTSMTDLEKFPGALKPAHVYADSQGLGPVTFLVGSNWRGWNGQLAVGVMATERVDILKLRPNGNVSGVTTARISAGRVRSLVMGPENKLFIATDGGSIMEVTAR